MGTVHFIKPAKDPVHQDPPNRKPPDPPGSKGKRENAPLAFHIAHALPGRLRLIFPQLKHRKEMICRVADALSLKPGVERVRQNHFCGSITVRYDPQKLHEATLVEQVKSMGEEDLTPPGTAVIPIKTSREASTWGSKNGPVKSSFLWTLGGTLFVAMSFLGVIIPGLPTPPFVILAAYCYLRGSTRHYRWIMNHPLFGRLVEETENGPRITHGAKKTTVYFLWLSIFLSSIFFVHSMLARLFLILLGIVASCYMLRK